MKQNIMIIQLMHHQDRFHEVTGISYEGLISFLRDGFSLRDKFQRMNEWIH